MRLRILLVTTLCLLLGGPALAQRNKLVVGNAAPGLDVETWVKGEATTIQKDRVYVVEFWATWCKPCLKSIPHLTELQKAYEHLDLTVIGVSTEKLEKVEPFVRSRGDDMDYRVAVDRRNSTERAWMKAAGRDSIPTAFIVDTKGVIQFIGHPLDEEFNEVLSLVIAGRYDAILNREMGPTMAAAENARSAKNWRMAEKLIDDLIEKEDHVFALWQLEKFEMLLLEMKEPDRAYAHANALLKKYEGDPDLLSELAEMLLTDARVPKEPRRLEVARKAAMAAAQRYHRNEPRRYEIQALVHYHAGDLDKAVRMQKKAYFVARPLQKPTYERVLRTYQQAAEMAQVR